jgi:DNA anti-recombination protein RmuC
MAFEAEKSAALPEDHKVPADLLQMLHAANEQFHRAKQLLEAALADTEYQHQQKIDQAEEQLRAAEREVEKVTTEIQGALKPPANEKGS